MATLHFFGGGKGGVGKSLLTRTAVQYHLDRAIEFALFDADQDHADVKRVYSSVGCRDAVFSKDKKDEDKALCTYYAAAKKQTLVNLPAQIEKPFQDWFKKNELFELSKDDGVEFTIWFVCSGSYDSLDTLGKSLSFFQDKVNHVLVKNWGVCDDWEALDKDEILQDKITEYGVKILDFPEFSGNMCLNIIDKNSLTFGAAREYSGLSSVNRQRVRTFLKQAYRVFDDAGIFHKSEKANRAVEVVPSQSVQKFTKVKEPEVIKEVEELTTKSEIKKLAL